jgi:hypothetical protein
VLLKNKAGPCRGEGLGGTASCERFQCAAPRPSRTPVVQPAASYWYRRGAVLSPVLALLRVASESVFPVSWRGLIFFNCFCVDDQGDNQLQVQVATE